LAARDPALFTAEAQRPPRKNKFHQQSQNGDRPRFLKENVVCPHFIAGAYICLANPFCDILFDRILKILSLCALCVSAVNVVIAT